MATTFLITQMMANFINPDIPIYFQQTTIPVDIQSRKGNVSIIQGLLPITKEIAETVNKIFRGSFELDNIIYIITPEYLDLLAHTFSHKDRDLNSKFYFYTNINSKGQKSLVIEQTGPNDSSSIFASEEQALFTIHGNLFNLDRNLFFHTEQFSSNFRALQSEEQTVVLGLIDDIVGRVDYASHIKPLWYAW